jgi:hypothetical protein
MLMQSYTKVISRQYCGLLVSKDLELLAGFGIEGSGSTSKLEIEMFTSFTIVIAKKKK